MGPWMKTFFLDLQKAQTARFYRAVGQFGEQFIEFEHKYLTMLV
jgi:TorA maturation chaperone TorD